MKCESWSPEKESALNPKPACWDKKEHGYLNGCTCHSCFNRQERAKKASALGYIPNAA